MTEDIQPQYTTKRLHDEIAKAREQGRQDVRAEIAAAASNPSPVSSSGGSHPDDLAVDRFAAAMKAKLAEKRGEGYGGWDDPDDCPPSFLSRMLREHVEKGDPVDVSNFAMMLHQRGEVIK